MRAYILDSKEQDLSYIPINSFVYNDGCGFIKRNQTTAEWSDVDFERIYCTDNDKLNPVIKKPEDEVLLKDAEVLKFVINGAFSLDKGATITEITFKDILGNPLEYDLNNFEDISLVNGDHWDNADNFEGSNLFDGNKNYFDTISGPISSTIFNLDPNRYEEESTFYIRLTAEQMKVIDSIEILAGSPTGRVPRSISIYAIKNKDDVQTRIETLIFYRAFKLEVDGNRPAQSFIATQKVRPEDPCMELFLNGFTEDGIHLVMNPYTGLLTTIYCEFQDLVEYMDENDEWYAEYMNSMCSRNPRSQIITKDIAGNFSQISISEFLIEKNWICYIDGCNQFTGNQYTQCIESICEARSRNPLTTVISYDDNLNELRENVEDYLRNRNVICNENVDAVFVDNTQDTESIISNLDSMIENGDNSLITILNPATGEKIEVTPTEYKSILSGKTQTPLELAILDGWTQVESDRECAYKLTKPNLDDLYIKIDYCVKALPIAYNTKDADDEQVIEIDITEYNLDLNNLVISDSLKALSYKLEVEIIEEPELDIDGNPIPGGGTVLKEYVKIIFDSVTLPDGFSDGVTTISISDGEHALSIDLSIKEDIFSLLETFSFNKPFTIPMIERDNQFKKAFEYDEPGAVIKFFAETNPIQISGNTDKLIIEVVKGLNRDGIIKIKSLYTDTDITEGFVRETLTVTSGNISHTLLIDITKHMRVSEIDNKSTDIDIGEIIVDNGDINYPIFNINNIQPLVLTAGEFHYYLLRNKQSRFHKSAQNLDIWTGPCVQLGLRTKIADGVLTLTPYEQQLNTREFYILDPYFNEINKSNGLIEPEQVHSIRVKYTVNKYLVVNVLETTNFTIDKYRYTDSKNNFKVPASLRIAHRDFKIMYQAEGLSLEVEKPLIMSIGYGSFFPSEDMYFDCRNGGQRPKVFEFNTDERYTELGTTNVRVFDSESEINFNVEVQQFIDINLPYNINEKCHTLFPSVVGSTSSVQLLHPFGNNWNDFILWTDDDSIVELNVNVADKQLELVFNRIGETFAYISDKHRSQKIKIISNYGQNLTPEYKHFKLLNTDTGWKEVQVFNVHGTLNIDSVDSSFLEVEVIDTIIRFRNLKTTTTESTVINFTDINPSDGNVSQSFRVSSIGIADWVVSRDLASELFTWELDNSEVFFEVEIEEEI